jgi:hypothetical protein
VLIHKIENPYPLAEQDGIPFDNEAVHRFALDGGERLVKIGHVSHFDNAKPHAETSRANLHFLQTSAESWVGGIHEHNHALEGGDDFAEDLQSFAAELGRSQ